MDMNISGNFKTADKEIEIVKRILTDSGIDFDSVQKSDNQDDEDIIVKSNSTYRLKTIEVKEESMVRIAKYNDLGIDYISAFYFNNPKDEFLWKGAPKKPERLLDFESRITIVKPGKIYYSKADLWLFYSIKNGEIDFHDWFLGSDMTSVVFIEYLRNTCLFAVNNKPNTQMSYKDRHQSATFFINRNDDFLLSLKKDVKTLFT